MTRWLANVSIMWKLFMAPAIAVALLSLMAPLALFSLSRQAAVIEELSTSVIDKAAVQASLARAIAEANNVVNRLIALASNSEDPVALKRLAAELDQRLIDATSLVDRLASFDLQQRDKQIVTEIGGALRAYAGTSRQIAGMAAADVPTAFMVSVNGQKAYAELMSRLDTLHELDREHTSVERQAAKAQSEAARLGMLALFAGAVLLSILVTVVLSRMIGGAIARLTASTLKLADGDLDVAIRGGERKDEIGILAGAIGVFKSNALEKQRIEQQQVVQQSKAAQRQAAIEQHIAAFELQVRDALATLEAASEDMRGTAARMSSTAGQTNDQVAAVASASERASHNVATVAAASEQLSASIAEISRQVSSAAGIAGRAVDEARQTDLTVQGLSEVVGGIRDVVKLIADIAGQTNLLALNATIEAARAGESGKGFAVVANEVKSLATQTAKATGEISAQIESVENVTRATVEAMKRIGGTISEVSSVASSIASAVEQQGAATQEITRSTQQAAARTEEVSGHVSGVSDGARTTSDAARGVKSAAEILSQETGRLGDQVNEFLTRIRAA